MPRSGVFAVDGSYEFAAQIPDDSVGCSGSRCSACHGAVAYCEQVCEHCSLPFIGPVGFPQVEMWRALSEGEKIGLVEEIYRQDLDRGRLSWANQEFVPLSGAEQHLLNNYPPSQPLSRYQR